MYKDVTNFKCCYIQKHISFRIDTDPLGLKFLATYAWFDTINP